VEIAWFAALCDDDTALLGVPDLERVSSWEHCLAIVLEAERQGFDSILLPSGYELGIDSVAFAAAAASVTTKIRLLLAVRIGEMWPPQLARQLATIDQIAAGRLDVNIISSPLPGELLESAARYARTEEAMAILAALLSGDPVNHHGVTYDLEVEPPRITRDRARRPPFYFGGLSEEALGVAARASDVYLMWPDTLDRVETLVADMKGRARAVGRTIRFGYRVHVVVRETEFEARAAATHLLSALEPDVGEQFRARSLDAASTGVARQSGLRDLADDEGYVDGNLFTGIGRARSGCGAAIVGNPEQVVAYLRELERRGIDAVILSGYPHIDEAKQFGELVLAQLDHAPISPTP